MTSIRSIGCWVLAICVPFIRVALGCMFLCSALPKIRQPYDFLANVYSYQLVGPILGLIIATVLPWLELGIGMCLVGRVLVTGSLLISFFLAGIFTFAVGSALHRGLNISCGCFATSPTDVISFLTLIRAIGIMLVSVLAYLGTILSQPRALQRIVPKLIPRDDLSSTHPSPQSVLPLPQGLTG